MPSGVHILLYMYQDILTNEIAVLQGGARSTAWKRLKNDSGFIPVGCWPEGIPQQDPSKLSNKDNSALFKHLQQGDVELLGRKHGFQFQ
jgi:hypothetical protein